MNKLFIRLFVAFAAFSLGLVLTAFFKPAPKNRKVVTVLLPHELPVLPSGEDETQILEIYSYYGPAQTRHDRKFFERVETEDFTLTVDGMKMTREEDLRWMEQQPTDITYESKVDHLKVFGNLAVAHGRFEIRYGNGALKVWPFADVWVKRGNTWRINSTTAQ